MKCLRKLQVKDPVLLTTVTMMYIRSPELPHLTALTDISPFPPPPGFWKPHFYSLLLFYFFLFFYFFKNFICYTNFMYFYIQLQEHSDTSLPTHLPTHTLTLLPPSSPMLIFKFLQRLFSITFILIKLHYTK